MEHIQVALTQRKHEKPWQKIMRDDDSDRPLSHNSVVHIHMVSNAEHGPVNYVHGRRVAIVGGPRRAIVECEDQKRRKE